VVPAQERKGSWRSAPPRLRTSIGALSVAAALWLTTSVALAYRTGQDLPELETHSAVGWATDTVQFRAAGNLPPEYQIDGIDATLRAALAPWNAASCGAITASYVGFGSSSVRHGDGVNTISFVFSGWGAMSSREAAATTDVVYEHRESTGWHIVEADIYINAQDYSWSQGAWSSNSKDLYTVLQHEVGHALGLLHPCEADGADGAPACSDDQSFASSVMYPFYQFGARSLSDDDRAGLCFLYDCDPTCDTSGACDGQDCSPSCPGPGCPKLECGSSTSCSTPECRSTPECATSGGSPLGDPCTKASDCESGICSAGFCAAEEPAECTGSDCSSQGAPLGAPCENSSDCAGGECLIGAKPHSICTRSCASEETCPGGWSCAAVTGEQVCAPIDYRPSGGCAFGPTPRSEHFIWLGLPWLAFWQRRRRDSARRTTK
jgi:hypothetical protein